MKRKLLILSVVLCLAAGLFALTACGGEEEVTPPESEVVEPVDEPPVEPPPATNDDDDDDDDDGTGEVVENGGIPVDPLGRFDETVDVTQTRILTAWMGFDEGENEDYNWWTRAYYEHLNIRLTNLFTADNWGEPFDMAINLAFATGELPDVMPLYTSLAVRALEGGLVMDITDLFATHASQQVQEIFAIDPRAHEAWSVNGRLMGLSNPLSTPDFSFIWVPRSMLYDFNGGTIPTTFEELNELAYWVRDYTGGHAIGLDNQLRELGEMTAMFGATDQWIERGGELVWGRVQPEMRDTWAQFAEWYADGVLAVDFAVRSDDDVEADFINRRFGLAVGGSHMPNGSRGRNYMLLHPDDDLVAIPMMTVSGAPINVIRSGGYNDVLMISANASEEVAVAIMRMYNLGTAIENDAERPNWVTNHYFNTTPGGNMGWWNRMATGNGAVGDIRPEFDAGQRARNLVLAGSDGSELVDTRAFRALENFERVMDWLNYGTNADNWEGNWAMWSMLLGSESSITTNQMFAEGRVSHSPRWGVETPAEAVNNANLAARYVEFATLAIMQNDVDNQFDQWVAFFENNGGDEINAQVNEWWAEHR